MKVKYSLMQSSGYKAKKEQRMKELKRRRQKQSINCARDYFVIANSVSGETRIASRVQVIVGGDKKGDGEE